MAKKSLANFNKEQRIKEESFFDKFERLASIQATQAEILYTLKTTKETLDKQCQAHYKVSLQEAINMFRAEGISSLRRVAWQKANEGNDKMIIYLMNNYTEAKQNPETAVTINNQVSSNTNLITLTKEEELKLAESLDNAGVLDTLFDKTKEETNE